MKSKGFRRKGSTSLPPSTVTLPFSLASVHRVVLLGFLAIAPFSAIIFGDFVFDDSEAILNNPVVTHPESVFRFFTTDFWGRPIRSPQSHKSYRPITTITFAVNHLLFGASSSAYHIVNVLLHFVVVLLVYETTSRIVTVFGNAARSRERIAFYTAILFAVHPVHTEAVSSIVGRAELLMACFLLLTICLHAEGIRQGNFTGRRKLTIFCCAVLSVLCKEQGISALPLCAVFGLLAKEFSCKTFLSLVLSRNADRRNNNRLPKESDLLMREHYLPCLTQACECILACLLLVFSRLYINGFVAPNFTAFDNPIAFHPFYFVRMINYCYLVLLNVRLLIYPSELCFDYSMGCIPLIERYSDPRLLLALFVPIAAFYALLHFCFMRYNKLDRISTFALVFTIVSYAPASNLFVTVGFVLAERVLYVPSLGVCILCSVAFIRLEETLDRHRKEILRCVGLLAILAAATKSAKRCAEWSTEVDLYKSGLEVCPNNAKIHYNLGKVLADRGDSHNAELNYLNALKLNPLYEHAMNNLANLYLFREDNAEAERLLRKCVQLKPTFAAAWMNLGLALLKQRRYKESEDSFATALRIRPHYPDCVYNMGNLYLQQNLKHQAETIWRNVTRQYPKHERAWVNLLVVLDEQNDCEEVVRLSGEVLSHLPDNPAIRFQLGTCYGKLSLYARAEAHLRMAVALDTTNALYHTNLGILYQRWGKHKEASEAYRMAVALEPAGSVVAKENLAVVLHSLNTSPTIS